jgi:hypothetical protein
MKISDLSNEGRKAFEEHLLSTYRYDTATGKLINKKWNREYPGMIDKSNKGYVYIHVYFQGERFKLWKHRLVFFLVTGRFPKEIDHLNGIKTDNRIENLREVNRSENEANKLRKWKKNPDSGLPGITKSNMVFQTKFRRRRLFSSIPEMLFFHLTLLGRRFM